MSKIQNGYKKSTKETSNKSIQSFFNYFHLNKLKHKYLFAFLKCFNLLYIWNANYFNRFLFLLNQMKFVQMQCVFFKKCGFVANCTLFVHFMEFLILVVIYLRGL